MAVEVVLPMLGITVERGKILEWVKREGDPVRKGEILFIVEVEKATTEVESPASGVLAKILLPVGVEVPILSLVAIITEPGEALPAEYRETAPVAAAVGPAESEASAPRAREAEQPAATTGAPGVVRAMPAARKRAAVRGIDLKALRGSGPEGVILVRDVEAAAPPGDGMPRISTLARKLAERESVPLEKVQGTGVRGRVMRADVSAYVERAAAPGAAGLGAIIPMSTVRRVIARRMSESAYTAPHIHFFAEVWMDPLLELRARITPDFEKHFALRPSINDFLIKAVALNILDFPLLNAQIKGDEIHIMPEIHVGLAVAREEGLIVPAIAHADRLGLVEIGRQREDLVERARTGRLTLEEMERGTFTISSLAQYEITHFTAILNPPQSGILSVGKTDEKLVLVDGQVKVKKVAMMGLSADHRIIDGTVAADFLQNLKRKLENPHFTFLAL